MPRRNPAVIFIFVTLVLDVLGIGLIIPVAPKLVEALQGRGESQASYAVGLLTGLYAAMQLIFAPVLGSLSDRFGRRPVLLISLLGSGLDYVAMALSPTLAWLFVTRAINGISGASMTVASAYVADTTTPEKRAAGFGMLGAAFGIGFVFGPLLGGVLGEWDLRAPFLAAAGLTLVNWLYGCFVLPESLPRERRRPFSLLRANPVVSLVHLGAYPIVLGLAIALFLVNVAQFGLQAVWVLYTTHRYEWSSRQVGVSLAIVGISAAIIQGGLARRVIPKLGEPRAILIGLGLAVAQYAGYGLATHGWMIYAIIAAAAIGAIAGPAAQALITKAVRPDEQGRVQGALTSLQSMAGIVGPLVATRIYGLAISGTSRLEHPGASFFAGAFFAATAWLVAAITLRGARAGGNPPQEDRVSGAVARTPDR